MTKNSFFEECKKMCALDCRTFSREQIHIGEKKPFVPAALFWPSISLETQRRPTMIGFSCFHKPLPPKSSREVVRKHHHTSLSLASRRLFHQEVVPAALQQRVLLLSGYSLSDRQTIVVARRVCVVRVHTPDNNMRRYERSNNNNSIGNTNYST